MKPGLSLTARIGWGLLLSGMSVLLAIGWFLDRSMQANLMEEHVDMLVDHLAMLRREAANDGPDLHEAREVVLVHLGGTNAERTFGRLVDAGGNILAETPGFADYSPASVEYPLPVDIAENVPEFASRVSPSSDGMVYVCAARIARPAPLPELIYYVVNDASQEQKMVRRFRLQLIVSVIAGSILCSGLGWLVTRRGLRPLARITEEIQSTTADALQNPDAPPPAARVWPRELAGLAGAFASLRSRITQSFDQLRRFSDDAAHELRSPLNNMMALTSLTLQRERTAEEYQNVLASTLEECDRLRRLADGLLFISRADHRRSALQISSFESAEAVREIMDYHSDIAQDQGISLEFQGGGLLAADRTLFRQALTNLMSNALRHTPDGGTIQIGFSPASQENGDACLTVADTGEGISLEHLPHVFDRFYRVDAARTRFAGAVPQTGLGLAIVKAIMELHGGTARVDSQAGAGTCFTLKWPHLDFPGAAQGNQANES